MYINVYICIYSPKEDFSAKNCNSHLFYYNTRRQIYFFILWSHVPFLRKGWQRFVGSLNCQVSFAKEPYCCRALSQKRPGNLGSLQIVATSYARTLPVKNHSLSLSLSLSLSFWTSVTSLTSAQFLSFSLAMFLQVCFHIFSCFIFWQKLRKKIQPCSFSNIYTLLTNPHLYTLF